MGVVRLAWSEEDKTAFLRTLFLENYRIMIKFATVFFSNPDIAEDATQETFLVAQMCIDKLILSPNPAGWLMNTLKNVIGDIYRKRKKLLENNVPLVDDMHSHDLQIHPRLMYKGIVSDDDLDLIIWIHCDGMTYKEAADKLGISKAAVGKRIQRAMERFRDGYKE